MGGLENVALISECGVRTIRNSLDFCSDKANCMTVDDILKAFNAPLSEDHAWALIYQYVLMYKNFINIEFIDKHTKAKKDKCSISHRIKVPKAMEHLSIHKDGSVHVSFNDKEIDSCIVSSQKMILFKLGIVIYSALDFKLAQDEECIISQDLEHLINFMIYEEIDDEGIEQDSEDIDDEKFLDTKELDYILERCSPRVAPSQPEEHYKAVCRALATESNELRIFLTKVFTDDAEALRIKADAQTSRQELGKLHFSDWARFWMQVVDELRRGVRLKKNDFSNNRGEYTLTPYEILMEDIRSRNFNLRKVMVNGDIPILVRKDAHAVILEFIRSRPPLRKATDRTLAPLKRNPSPREQLLDSIRKGRSLRPINPRLKSRLLPATKIPVPARVEKIDKKIAEKIAERIDDGESKLSSLTSSSSSSSQPHRRLITVDFSLFKDDEILLPASRTNGDESHPLQPNGADYQSTRQVDGSKNNENNQNNINTILRRTTYDLATQCESRRASTRRHTIVGCSYQNIHDSHSVPPSRPDSRQSTDCPNISQPVQVLPKSHQTQQQAVAPPVAQAAQVNACNSSLPPTETWSKSNTAESMWKDQMSANERLSLTLEEIVHIRSVMTKAELDCLPVGIHIKEDVEKRKLCFLCLRTKFGILGPRGVPCKLCQRTVCAKCYSKMRIPTEHFSNVPVLLLSPSLQNSPLSSNAPSPSHHAHGAMDETFPRSLMERLLWPESDRKARNTVGSAPSSPKNQRSTSSTPGSSQHCSMTMSLINPTTTHHPATATNGVLNALKDNHSNNNSIMSRSMEVEAGHRSLPPQSPGRPHSNSSTLDRRSNFKKAFTLMQPQYDHKEGLRGEMMAVCNDCKGLVLDIIRYSRQTRSTARQTRIKTLTLDLSPVYKH